MFLSILEYCYLKIRVKHAAKMPGAMQEYKNLKYCYLKMRVKHAAQCLILQGWNNDLCRGFLSMNIHHR